MLHIWYLSKELVVTAIADNAVENKEKIEISVLLKPENIAPQVYRKGKPMLHEISEDTQLSDLIGPEGLQILEVVSVTRSDIIEWAESGIVAFITFVKQLTCKNDYSKHNNSLVQDFCNYFYSEPLHYN